MKQSRLGRDTTTPSTQTSLRGRMDDSPIGVSGKCRKGYLSYCEPENSNVVLGNSSGYGEWKVPTWHLDGDNNRQFQNLSQFTEELSQQESPSMKFQWDKLLEKPGKMNDGEHNKSGDSPRYGACASRTQVDNRHSQGCVSADVVHFPICDSSPAKRSTSTVYQDNDINNGLKEEERRLYSKDASHCVIPTSTPQLTAPTGRPFGNSAKHSCIGIAGSGGYNPGSSGLGPDPNADAYSHTSHFKPSTDSNMQLEVQKKYSTVHVSPCELNERPGELCGFVQRVQDEYDLEYAAVTYKFHGKFASIRKDYDHDLESLSKKYKRTLGSVQDDCYGDSLSHSPVDIEFVRKGVTENSLKEQLTDGTLQDNYPSSLAHPLPKYVNAASSFSTEKRGECSDSATMHRDGRMQDDQGGANIFSRKDSKEMDNARSHVVENQQDMVMTNCRPGIYGTDNSHHKKLSEEDQSLLEQPKRVKRKHDIDQISMEDNRESKLSCNKNISSETHYTESDKSVLNVFEHMYNRTDLDSNVLSSPTLSRSSSRDIKKRLGPHVPSPRRKDNDLSPISSVKKEESPIFLKNNHHGVVHSEERGLSSGRKHTTTKFDPPENSLDFKEMVNGAFVEFVRQLNDDMELCRRLKEQGKAGTLKCSVCGSKEFLDTKSLVMHACTDPSVELRAQHFGFHKALCSLMGWKCAEVLNTQWVYQMLPDAESLFLKEDAIIWPPVVVVHNSSIANVKRGGRQLVSVQMLETMVRGAGFVEKIKVYHGRLASQSIMVIQFSGTYSGLQEAERLHWFYANKEHGRTEFQQQINQNSQLVIKRRTRNLPPEKVDDVLYGYLGVAGDLEKLDFEMKKHCVVRSRKEIQDLANVRL